MIGWARAFLALTLMAALFGLGHLAATSVGVAQTLLVSFLAAFLVALILGLVGGLKMSASARYRRRRVGGDIAALQGGSVPSRGQDPRATPRLEGPRQQGSRRA